MEKELELAHQEYEERKERIISNLKCMLANLRTDSNIPDLYSDWLDDTIKFIKEGEV